MKRILLVVFTVAGVFLVLGFWAGWRAHLPTRPQYEFHTGVSGALIWRCDKVYGTVSYSTVQNGLWRPIFDPIGGWEYPTGNPILETNRALR
jgi:hypothetical protein